MIKFPSINQFRNVVNHVRQQARFMGLDENGEAIMDPSPVYPTLGFVGTVKLHGTNAAIVFKGDEISFQSRERVLSFESDNAGFLAHFQGIKNALWFQLVCLLGRSHLDLNETVAIYGEWCGGNIQKGVAITGLPKMFVVFAVKINDTWRPDLVHMIRKPENAIYNIEQFPKWITNIDFENPEKAQNLLSELTLAVEDCCPVGKHFGQEGIGEGIVWRCIENASSEYWFKVKGEKHSVSQVKTLAAVDVETIESIRAFVDSVVTKNRLQQGLKNLTDEQQKPFAMTSLGDFIRWVHNDVVKEEADTIAANGFEYKKLGGPIALVAKRWFIEELNAHVMG